MLIRGQWAAQMRTQRHALAHTHTHTHTQHTTDVSLVYSSQVAVTQNFVSSVNLRSVLDFIRPGRTELVSGCAMHER